MNSSVDYNLSKLKPISVVLPLFLILLIVLFLYNHDSLSTFKYVQIQKDSFFYLNHRLGQYPNLEYNLTQIGDASIFLSFLTIFIIDIPKLWSALLSASLISLLFANILKKLFDIPRPAQAFDPNSIIIVGKKVTGFASLPSGHAITIFTTITVLLFAFMPKELKYKILLSLFTIIIGVILVFTRVGVGAHYPLDVIIGGIVGYLSGIIGIFITQRYKSFEWVSNKKYYPVFLTMIGIIGISIINKIINENLIIYYLALMTLCFSFYKIIYVYLKK